VFWYHESEFAVTEGGIFGTEFGTEPPAKISINTWHKLFNKTGRIRAKALISNQSLNERKDIMSGFYFQSKEPSLRAQSTVHQILKIHFIFKSHKRKHNSPSTTKRLATYFVATLYQNLRMTKQSRPKLCLATKPSVLAC